MIGKWLCAAWMEKGLLRMCKRLSEAAADPPAPSKEMGEAEWAHMSPDARLIHTLWYRCFADKRFVVLQHVRHDIPEMRVCGCETIEEARQQIARLEAEEQDSAAQTAALGLPAAVKSRFYYARNRYYLEIPETERV